MAKLKVNETKKLYAHLIVDRSGSMESMGRKEIVNSINSWVEGYKKDKDLDATLSVTFFDTSGGIEHVRVCKSAKSIKLFDKEEYSPNGFTNLFDTIGSVVGFIRKDVDLQREEKVALTIITDGMENASQEIRSISEVKTLLENAQKEDDWYVTYLGTNQDGWAVGQNIGIYGASSATYAPQNFASAVSMAQTKSVDFTKIGRAAATYTNSDRKELNSD